MDAGVVTAVLCSVADPAAALRELARVIRPGGELRFFEHVAARSARLARVQRSARRDRLAAPERRLPHEPRHRGGDPRRGFQIEERDRFSFRAHVLGAPVAPRILGRARRPG